MILFIISFASSVAFTYYIRKILIGANVSDNPIVSEHRHKAGTPTMGGIAFLFSVLFVASIYFKNQYILVTSLIMLTAGIAGLLDDLIGFKVKEYQKLIKNITNSPLTIGQLTLNPGEEARAATPKAKEVVDDLLGENKLELVAELPIKNEMGEIEKIIGQLVIGIFLVITGAVVTLGGFSLGPFVLIGGTTIGLLAIPVILIAVIGAINAINLIDGMDGLASGINSYCFYWLCFIWFYKWYSEAMVCFYSFSCNQPWIFSIQSLSCLYFYGGYWFFCFGCWICNSGACNKYSLLWSLIFGSSYCFSCHQLNS